MSLEKLEQQGRQSDVPAALNALARYQAITHLLADITVDLIVCKLEGWDPEQYVNQLKDEIDRIYNKFKKEEYRYGNTKNKETEKRHVHT